MYNARYITILNTNILFTINTYLKQNVQFVLFYFKETLL